MIERECILDECAHCAEVVSQITCCAVEFFKYFPNHCNLEISETARETVVAPYPYQLHARIPATAAKVRKYSTIMCMG